MKTMTLGKFPFPPSTNNQYATIMRNGVPIRIPSSDYKIFKARMADWHMKRDRLVTETRNFMLEIVARKNFFRVDKYYCVPKAEIYYKNGNLRKRDVSNFVKAIDDEFVKMVAMDDSRIKASYIEEMGIEGDDAFVFIVVSEHKFRTISEYVRGEVPSGSRATW